VRTGYINFEASAQRIDPASEQHIAESRKLYDAGLTTLDESQKLEGNEVRPKDNTPVRETEFVDKLLLCPIFH